MHIVGLAWHVGEVEASCCKQLGHIPRPAVEQNLAAVALLQNGVPTPSPVGASVLAAEASTAPFTAVEVSVVVVVVALAVPLPTVQ